MDHGDKISIVQSNPTTMNGTNFRSNNIAFKSSSEGKVEVDELKKNGLTVEEAVKITMDAADVRKRKVNIPIFKMGLAELLYP